MARISQPAITAATRASEDRPPLVAYIGIALAMVFLLVGFGNRTGIDTLEGRAAREFELIKSFTTGGLQAKAAVTVPDLGQYDDPAEALAAVERAEKQSKEAFPITYRVNTGAVDPCPT